VLGACWDGCRMVVPAELGGGGRRGKERDAGRVGQKWVMDEYEEGH
jgi:hypothetical protein